MAKASGKRVLVVEDEPDVRNFLVTCLRDVGFIVDMAIDGVEALEKMEEEAPDLMTLDMVMPRKSGIELIRTLRKIEKWAKLPVIVITAHARDELGSDDIKGFNAFTSGLKPRYIIEKPVTPQKVIETICDILDVKPEESIESSKVLSTEEDALIKMIKESDSETMEKIKNILEKH